ncbi:hypothetical protein EGR_07584 [Echinococcus granulosus]|uniref:Uncharacterized protein n=1 Tax=Echinococcus granulosus TaxID=6210 RepID=W6U8J3_ECHGR|nr:hypothetical protein EGR_07584 [Echinococcus granulosus]EUB57573.1 hypothetical protein EGR_07584 [Echinococcus granulosus]
MYDRAERSINLTPREDLGPHLGPTSYNVKFEFKKCTAGGYAPFGSLGQRNTIFTLKRDEIPSPSAYSPKSSCIHIKITIRYVERTFPSIVATLDAHGYVAGPDGQLRPQSGQIRFCRNEMNSSNLQSCQRYRGCKWSSRTDYRKTFCPLNDYPGPGTYFTSMNDEWIRLITRGLQQNLTNSKHVLNVPRFIEKHVRDAKHEVSFKKDLGDTLIGITKHLCKCGLVL